MKKTIFIIIKSLKSLSFSKIIRLSSLILRYPLFSILGFYATLQTFQLAKKHFPKTHSTNGIGNAFRHALWCCLIAMYCSKISSSRKALAYCKKMTDLHEELFPNKPLEKLMDLHNNSVGMLIFQRMLKGIHRQFFEKQFFVSEIMEQTKSAKILKKIDDDLGDELVYLE